jgi:hypothetical protein
VIHFTPPPEPTDFDEKVRQPGAAWLAQHPTGRPKDFWGQCKGDLADGFRQLCAYSAMFEPVGTIDHYLSCDTDRQQAYQWSNYRFASGWINSSKRTADDTVLDPFQVEDGWFEIILPSLQLVLTDAVPDHEKKRAEYTLTRLHLCDDERVIRQRREWYRMYQEGELTLEGLEKKAPLIAQAVRKHFIVPALQRGNKHHR